MKKQTLKGLFIISFAALYIWIQTDSKPSDEKINTELIQAQKTSKAALLTKCQEGVHPMLKDFKPIDIKRKNTDYRRLSNGNFEVTTHYYAEDSFDGTLLGTSSCLFDKNGDLLQTAQVK